MGLESFGRLIISSPYLNESFYWAFCTVGENKVRKWASHSQFNTSQTTDCFWEDLQREVGFTGLYCLHRTTAQLQLGRKGAKATQNPPKLEQTSSLSGAAVVWLLRLWLLKGFYFQTTCCSYQLAPIFFNALSYSLSTPDYGSGRTQASAKIPWLMPCLLWIHIFTRYPQCRVATIPTVENWIHPNKMLISWNTERFPEILIFALAFEVHLLGLFLEELIFSLLWFSWSVHIPQVHHCINASASSFPCYGKWTAEFIPALQTTNSMSTGYSSPMCQKDVTISFIHIPQTWGWLNVSSRVQTFAAWALWASSPRHRLGALLCAQQTSKVARTEVPVKTIF